MNPTKTTQINNLIITARPHIRLSFFTEKTVRFLVIVNNKTIKNIIFPTFRYSRIHHFSHCKLFNLSGVNKWMINITYIYYLFIS